MKLRAHILMLVAVCSLGAVGLILWAGTSYRQLDHIERTRTSESLGLRDMTHLGELLGAWLTLSDLVVASEITHLLGPATEEGLAIQETLRHMAGQPLAAVAAAPLGRLSDSVERILDHVARAATASGPDRKLALKGALANLDKDAMIVVREYDAALVLMQAEAAATVDLISRRRASLMTYLGAGSVGYLFLVLLALRWNARTLNRPLLRLTQQARAAMEDGTPLGLREEGPHEVRQLTRTVSDFVDSLEQANETLEAKVKVRTSELQQASRAQTEFIASVSHELRTPLNVILGMTELALDASHERAVTEYLTQVESSSRQLRRLIADLLDFSRIDIGRLELEEEEVRVSAVAKDIDGMLRVRAQAKGIEFRMVGQDPEAPRLVVDATRLNQVLVNIVDNAIKFTNEGCVTVHFCQTPDAGSNESLRIDIRDTGIGIPPTELQDVFERFYQVDSSTHRRYEGTGLGLSIARDLVEAMGGTIAIDSSPGMGTCVTIDLTLRRAAEASAEEPAHVHAELSAVLPDSAGRALVVDDHPANRLLTRRFLEIGGWSVVEAADGHSALAAVEGGEFDVILMDLEMPGMDGFETARRIRSQAPELPIIALTAHALESYRLQCLSAGMNDCLAKPVHRERLLHRVRSFAAAG